MLYPAVYTWRLHLTYTQAIGQLICDARISSYASFIYRQQYSSRHVMHDLLCVQELIDSYLRKWKVDMNRIENGAQRVHEDTSRFSQGKTA